MPPRYAYWTILVDDQPTAFRAGSQEDLMPTFKRLKDKQPTAKMMWFQNGKLWPSRSDACTRRDGPARRLASKRSSGVPRAVVLFQAFIQALRIRLRETRMEAAF